MDLYTPWDYSWPILTAALLLIRFRRRPGVVMVCFLLLVSLVAIIATWIVSVQATVFRTQVWLASLAPGDPRASADTGDNVAALFCGWIPAAVLVAVLLAARLLYFFLTRRRTPPPAFPIIPDPPPQ